MNLLRKFLTLGAIIGSLPEDIQNGEIMDAVPVMANFNWIVAQVNLNVGSTGLHLTPLTTTQRNALTPAAGYLVYNSTTNKLNICVNATGPVWEVVTSA